MTKIRVETEIVTGPVATRSAAEADVEIDPRMSDGDQDRALTRAVKSLFAALPANEAEDEAEPVTFGVACESAAGTYPAPTKLGVGWIREAEGFEEDPIVSEATIYGTDLLSPGAAARVSLDAIAADLQKRLTAWEEKHGLCVTSVDLDHAQAFGGCRSVAGVRITAEL